MDIDILAGQVVPYVGAAVGAYGAGVMTRLEEAAADETVRVGQQLLRKLLGTGARRPGVEQAVTDLAAADGDPDFLAALRAQIRLALRQDPTLAAELNSLLPRDVTASSTGERAPAVAGANPGQISTGDRSQNIQVTGNAHIGHVTKRRFTILPFGLGKAIGAHSAVAASTAVVVVGGACAGVFLTQHVTPPTPTPTRAVTASRTVVAAVSPVACTGVATLTPYPVTQYGALPPGTTIPSGAEVYCLTFEDTAVNVNIPTTGMPIIAPKGLPNGQISAWDDTIYSSTADPATLTPETDDAETIQAVYTADASFICDKNLQVADIHGLAGCPGYTIPGRIGAYLPTGTADVTAAIAFYSDFNGAIPGFALTIQRPDAATIQRPNGLYVGCELDEGTATLCSQSLPYLLDQFMAIQGLDTSGLGPAYAEIATFEAQYLRAGTAATSTPSAP